MLSSNSGGNMIGNLRKATMTWPFRHASICSDRARRPRHPSARSWSRCSRLVRHSDCTVKLKFTYRGKAETGRVDGIVPEKWRSSDHAPPMLYVVQGLD